MISIHFLKKELERKVNPKFISVLCSCLSAVNIQESVIAFTLQWQCFRENEFSNKGVHSVFRSNTFMKEWNYIRSGKLGYHTQREWTWTHKGLLWFFSWKVFNSLRNNKVFLINVHTKVRWYAISTNFLLNNDYELADWVQTAGMASVAELLW